MDIIAIALAKNFAQNNGAIVAINKALAAADELNSQQDAILASIETINIDQKADIEKLFKDNVKIDTSLSQLSSDLSFEKQNRISEDKVLLAKIESNAKNIKNNADTLLDYENAFASYKSDIEAQFSQVVKDIATAKSEAIAEILGGALEQDYDTLKEVVDWIQSDTTGSAQLITRVTNLEAYTTELKNVKTPKIEADITTLFDRFPTISALDNGKFVKVENGKYTVVTVEFSTIYTGEATPAEELGRDGDLYIQYE